MTCRVEVFRWGLSSSSRSEAVWKWIQDSMGCQFVEELRFVSASRPPPRLSLRQQRKFLFFHRCVQNKQSFKTNSRSQNWQTMPRVLYLSCISQALLKFWTWHDNSLPKRSIKELRDTHIAFLQKHSTLNLQWWKSRVKHHTYYVCHYFEFSPLLSDILSDIFLNILSDILSQTFFLNFFQTYLLTFFLTYLLTCSLIAVEVRHATLNAQDRGWGPARHTELTGSRLRSGTPHWTHRIAVEVRHATLNSQDRGWGPARHTGLTGSRLRSGTPHWTHRIAVEVRHATLNSQHRGWGPAHHIELTWSQESPAHHTEVTGGGGRGGQVLT